MATLERMYSRQLATTNVYSLSLPYLISKLKSDERDGQVWKEVSGLQTTYSTPLSISGSLLAVDGKDKDEVVTAIHLYQPDTGEWGLSNTKRSSPHIAHEVSRSLSICGYLLAVGTCAQ